MSRAIKCALCDAVIPSDGKGRTSQVFQLHLHWAFAHPGWYADVMKHVKEILWEVDIESALERKRGDA